MVLAVVNALFSFGMTLMQFTVRAGNDDFMYVYYMFACLPASLHALLTTQIHVSLMK